MTNYTDSDLATVATSYNYNSGTYSVSGTVKDENGAFVNGATVKIMAGTNQIGVSVSTNASGYFSMSNIPSGSYNLVVSLADKEVIEYINVSNSNYVFSGFIVLPNGKKASKMNLVGVDTPNIIESGLHDLFGSSSIFTPSDQQVVTDGGSVELKLVVQKNDSSANKGTVEAVLSGNGYASGLVMDIDITKRVELFTGGVTNSSITDTGSFITLVVPLPAALKGKSEYVVSRAHMYGSTLKVDTITTTPNATTGEYLTVNGARDELTLHVKLFSTYVVAYKVPVNINVNEKKEHSGGGTGMASAPVVKPAETILPQTTPPQSISPQPTQTQPAGLPYYIDDSGKIVFIGFAGDTSVNRRYIALNDKKILFKENPKHFIDIANHWAKSQIDFVTEREIFVGVSNNVFAPESGMTRAMFATALGKLYERSYGTIPSGSNGKFQDVKTSDYFFNYVNWAAQNGIVEGIGANKFAPEREITREELVVILYKYAKFIKTLDENKQPTKAFNDDLAIQEWAKEAVAYFSANGIVTGKTGNLFAPGSKATRAEVAAILECFILQILKK